MVRVLCMLCFWREGGGAGADVEGQAKGFQCWRFVSGRSGGWLILRDRRRVFNIGIFFRGVGVDV